MTEMPNRAEVYKKYQGGENITGKEYSLERWSFTAYKKNSPVKHYEDKEGASSFSKVEICFHQCEIGMTKETCAANSEDKTEKCCVQKYTINGTSQSASPCELRWADEHAQRQKGLKEADGMKVHKEMRCI